ncbi:ATP-dependent DNA ligase [Leekyejoonella antrihumi]|uniref:Probable DNA ligase n=1 Tax=Leekyejoonella antrihumi TaxID=1660198 RepID=A0A563E3Y8_9MICO|nr:ATP-dependent DNA ligase [Leekyejoonella antrihumi]TWP37240.1 ATP-dependent DNA ligase [Leekyejoonella antrihumi]
MLLAELVTASTRVAATRSRNAKVEAIADALRSAEPAEVGLVAAYLSGVLPQRRLGVGWRGLREVSQSAEHPTLQVAEVDAVFGQIAGAHGEGSVARRAGLVRDLLARATEAEQRLLRGLIAGEIRQGALDGVMLKAIAAAFDVPEGAVRRAVMLAGYAAPVAAAAMAGGEAALDTIGLQAGRPMRPMLAASAPSIGDAFEELGGAEVAIECKIDGIRVQAHKLDDEVRLFTRSLEEVTDRLPEVVEAVASLPARALVLDGEVVALRPDGRPEPFQVTGARTASRKDPQQLRTVTPVTPLFFDILHHAGADLLDRPARERHALLAETVPSQWRVARAEPAGATEAQQHFEEWVAAGHEGVVLKRLDSTYAAGRRGAGWVKVKPRHTLDLVVLAVEWGSGRRRGKLSNIHLGARDPQAGGLVMLGKTFKGMTDEMLEWQTRRFDELAVERGDHVVTVRPEQVVEVAFDGVQRSTRYPSGLALRFARVIRYRDDKSADEADTIDTVRALGGL